MRLTRYSDYAMRVLLYVGARPERVCPIAEISRAYGVSQNHLMKVVNDLVLVFMRNTSTDDYERLLKFQEDLNMYHAAPQDRNVNRI